jgi:Leucine-rich repeat (LRR) protein
MEGEVGLVTAAATTTTANASSSSSSSSSAGCNAILCPPGTWSSHGKASTTLGLACQPCGNNVYYGETVCEETGHVGKSDEMRILDELFIATGGRYWNLTHTNWTKSGIPICYREGVVCAEPSADFNSGVSELRLTSFGLRGTIPTSIYQLPQVKRLAFSWNPGVEISFVGIGQAPQLEVLQLSGTKIGSLAGIESASHILYELHLAKAGLEGIFPTELLQVETLRSIYLSDNRLTGKIPSSISGMLALDVLKLDGNLLSGPIPGEVGLLSNLVTLDLHGNRLSGLIPPELGKLQFLEHLNLSSQEGDGKLTGPLYTFNTNPVLQNIDLSNNKFAGLLPSNFLSAVDPSTPIVVNLSFNKLAGSIPAAFDVFTNLDIKLAGNMITAVPGVLCDNTNWMGGGMPNSCDFILCPPHKVAPQGYATSTETCQDCSVSSSARFFGSTVCDTPPSQDERQVLTDFYHAMNGDNWLYRTNWLSDLTPCAWYGVYCLENLSVVDIRLANNGLENSGSDADTLAILSGLTNLRSLDLKGNAIVLNFMSLPASSALEDLRVSRTGLKSLDGISRATKLKVLHAVDNELSGSFSGEIFALQNLQELYLSFNRINGTLPAMISTLQNLQQL